MKNVSTLLILLLLMGSLFAESDLQQPYQEGREIDFSRRMIESNSRFTPEVDFTRVPEAIAVTYYDYMLGGYNNLPLSWQPEFSDPYGYPAEGLYHAFMYRQNASSLRRIYYTYIDANGNLSTPASISPNSVAEGFMGIAVDPVTGNPFVAWHNIIEPDGSYDCSMSYDMYNVVGGPGLWKQPFIVIDNPEVSAPFTGHDDDEFIWPQVWIGPSPEAGMRRVHIYGNNFTSNSGGVACYNSLYGYADFEYDDVNFDMSLSEWTYQTFPEFDNWHYNDVKRAIKDMAVSDDGKVVFVGHAQDEYFCYYSDNYGETFTFSTQQARWDVFNPQHQDGTYVWENTDGSPAEVFIYPNGDGSHFNAMFTDNNSKVVFMTAFGINTVETFASDQYYPAHFHPKMIIFDVLTGTYDFADLQVTGVDPYDDQPMIPYDLDEDGVVDSWDGDGFVEFASVWPSYFFAGEHQDGAFHESLFKVTKNDDMNWVVVIFQDGRNLMEAYYETPGYEDWAETAEIAIAVSVDGGLTWSDPAYLNAKADDVNYHEELDGRLPAYVYPADKIVYVDDNHGRIPIVFYDDASYGSFVQNYGNNVGGTQMYAEIMVEFPDPVNSVEGNEIVPQISLSQNYPNPFNPVTNINYSIKEAGDVLIEVYNVRGQKVTTLVNEYQTADNYSVTWDGTDADNKPVSSGIYYYKMSSKGENGTRKMVLLK